jgi:hypothetical protein
MSKQSSPRNRDVAAAERVLLALKLRLECLTYEEIAKRCGYKDASGARYAILRELERRIAPQVDELRRREQDILDALHAKVWNALGGEDGQELDLYAVDRILAISKSRRDLMGLDPERTSSGALLNRIYPEEWLKGVAGVPHRD